MAAQSPITAEELAEEASLSLDCLNLAFYEDHAHVLAEFCDPWENIGRYLHLNNAIINGIKEDYPTAEKRRIATLLSWKQKYAHRATYRVLVEAFVESGCTQQALELCCKIKELWPASESDGTSATSRDPVLLMTEPTSPVDRDSAPEFTIPDGDIVQSIESLQTQFIHIQNRFFQSDGAGTGVTLQQLRTCTFITDTPQAIFEVDTIPEFARNLKQYCCALDPDIVEGLIEEFGDVETKSRMRMYSKALRSFQHKTKLKDFIGNYEGPTPPDSEYKEVQIRFGDNWQENTLADAKQMKCHISGRLWLMKMVSRGSVCVAFMIPRVEDLELVELDVHLRGYLQSQGVLQISVCGKNIFNSEDTETQIEGLERQFTDIQIAARKELESRKDAIELVEDQLTAMALQPKHGSAISKIARRKRPFQNLKEFFAYLNAHTRCWNFIEYHLLKQLIVNTCSDELKRKMRKFCEDVQNFQRNTTITEFLKYRRHMAKEKCIPKSYKKLKMTHNINPDFYTLADLEKLRVKTCEHVKLSDFALQIYSIEFHCIVVEWMIPEGIVEILSLFYSSEVGQQLLRDHQVESIVIDGNSLCSENGRTILLCAVETGDIDLVQTLLEHGADVNIVGMDGRSSLIIAAKQGYELIILLLLDHEAAINFQQEASGRTAIFFAAENGHDAATSILIAYGADPDQQDVGGETPYMIAKKKGYTEVCEELLPPELKKQPEVRSDSARHKVAETLRDITKGMRAVLFGIDLIEAVKNDDLKAVKNILLKEREPTITIDARESDEHGWTALMWGSDRGNIKIVDLLLNEGANSNITSKSTKWSSLMIASRKGHLKVVKRLIERGAILDHQNVNGLSSLTISIYERRTAVALFLIHKGASIHLAEKTGWNPLSRASTEGNLKLLKIIADRGGHLNDVILEYNWTSVMLAAKYGHGEVVKELVERGADLTITTREGDTVLHIATLKRQPGVIKQLAIAKQPEDAKTKFSLDITNRDGLTALMVATNKGYVEEMDALLEGGADVNATHKGTGWTTIFFAAKNGSVEIVQNLLHHNAKTELDDGTRLIDVASHLKQMSIIDILGTDVDSKPASQLKEPQNVDRTVRTFEAAFRAMEERVLMWKKVA